MSATRASLSARRARVSASGPRKMSKMPMSGSPWSGRHERAQRAAERFRTFADLLGFLTELGEPIGGIDVFGVEHDAVHDHGDAGLEAALVDLELVMLLAEFDRDAGDFCGSRKQPAAFVDGHEFGERFLEAKRKCLEIAFGVRLETAQPRRLQ